MLLVIGSTGLQDADLVSPDQLEISGSIISNGLALTFSYSSVYYSVKTNNSVNIGFARRCTVSWQRPRQAVDLCLVHLLLFHLLLFCLLQFRLLQFRLLHFPLCLLYLQ